MRILGIDPGLANTGWGVVDFDGHKFRPVSYGTIKTVPGEKLEHRISQIAQQAAEIAEKYEIKQVSMEDIFFAKNEISAIGVAKVIGAICYAMYKQGIEVTIFTPLQIKQAITGAGRADKKQVQEMCRLFGRSFPHPRLLSFRCVTSLSGIPLSGTRSPIKSRRPAFKRPDTTKSYCFGSRH